MTIVQPPIWPSVEMPLPPEQRTQAGEDCPCAGPARTTSTRAEIKSGAKLQRDVEPCTGRSLAPPLRRGAKGIRAEAAAGRYLRRHIGHRVVPTRQRSHIASEHPIQIGQAERSPLLFPFFSLGLAAAMHRPPRRRRAATNAGHFGAGAAGGFPKPSAARNA